MRNRTKKGIFVEKSIIEPKCAYRYTYDFPINRSLVYGIVCCFYRVEFKREE